MTFDLSGELGERAERRFRDEIVIWLVTVSASGAPQPSPVWFLWDDATFLIYSQPETPKLRNIAANPRVALHLDSADGEDVVIVSGRAEVLPGPTALEVPAYMEKYAERITDIGYDAASFGASYSVPIRVTPARLRGF